MTPPPLVSTPTSDAIAIYNLISLLYAHCPACTTFICGNRGMPLPLSQEMHAGSCSPKADPTLSAIHNLMESWVSHVRWSSSSPSLQRSDLIIPPPPPSSFTPSPLFCIFPVQLLLRVAMAMALQLPSPHVWWCSVTWTSPDEILCGCSKWFIKSQGTYQNLQWCFLELSFMLFVHLNTFLLKKSWLLSLNPFLIFWCCRGNWQNVENTSESCVASASDCVPLPNLQGTSRTLTSVFPITLCPL